MLAAKKLKAIFVILRRKHYAFFRAWRIEVKAYLKEKMMSQVDPRKPAFSLIRNNGVLGFFIGLTVTLLLAAAALEVVQKIVKANTPKSSSWDNTGPIIPQHASVLTDWFQATGHHGAFNYVSPVLHTLAHGVHLVMIGHGLG